MTDELAPRTLWPLSGLRVVEGDLELRYLDDEHLFPLAALAGTGVHSPDAMPFSFPWSVGTPTEVARRVLAYQWSVRSQISAERWAIELVAVRDGEVLGVQALMATDFPLVRTIETGSWIGLRHQGAGVGTRLRRMALHLAFEGLDARWATTEAWTDNGPSNGVTRKLGYLENGTTVLARQEQAVAMQRYRMDRERWEATRAADPETTLHGVDAVRDFLGITESRPNDPESTPVGEL